MQRRLTLRYDDGTAAAGVKVVVQGQRGRRVDGVSDGAGLLAFDWDDDWIDLVTVDGDEVKREWSFSYSQQDLELTVPRAGAGADGGFGSSFTPAPPAPVERTLRLRYRDGVPVAGKEVVVHPQRGEALRLMTDHDGRVRFPWPDDVIALVEVEQLPVKRDWSVSGFLGPQTELDLEVPRPTGARLEERAELRQADTNYRQAGVRGRLFYHDGTQVREPFKVTITLRGGRTYDTDQPRCYCHDNGEFFIATDEYAKSESVTRLWVRHDELDSSRWLQDAATGYYVVLIPKGFGRGGGDKGGVVAGEVVNRDGSPHPNCRIKAGVRASSFFGGAGEVETYADDKGRFILVFEGGVSLKYVYVDNNEPLAVFNGRHQGASRLDPHNVPAGSFGLVVVRQPGILS